MPGLTPPRHTRATSTASLSPPPSSCLSPPSPPVLTACSDPESRPGLPLTPDSSPSNTPAKTEPDRPSSEQLLIDQKLRQAMETTVKSDAQVADDVNPTVAVEAPAKVEIGKAGKAGKAKCTKTHCKKHATSKSKTKKAKAKAKAKRKKGKKAARDDSDDDDDDDDELSDDSADDSDGSSSSSSSTDSDSSSSSSSASSSSSDDLRLRRKRSARKLKLKKIKAKGRAKLKLRKVHRVASSDSDDDSSADDDSALEHSSEPEKARRLKKVRAHRRRLKKSRKVALDDDDDDDTSDDDESDDIVTRKTDQADIQAQIDALNSTLSSAKLAAGRSGRRGRRWKVLGLDLKSKRARSKKHKRASKVEFKRVDQLWDSTIHDYKLTDTAEYEETDEYERYIFTVRRKFDWDGKYTDTVVDIRSPALKDVLTQVMDGVKGVSLVEDTPVIDPNMLFLYLDEIKAAVKLLKKKLKKERKKKAIKATKRKIAHAKVLVKYLNEDYADTKKTLYPLLASNTITFDLLWALFKPNTIAYTTTYGNADEPRAFKIEYVTKNCSYLRGTWYSVEGRYLEYDGKSFGMGSMEVDVDAFKGPRRITGLATYPLQYHKDPAGLQRYLIERGRKFVALKGMNYRFHKGMAFHKKRRNVIKVNINGRVMVDPALHRRINPNYQISNVRPKGADEESDEGSDEESDDCGCDCGSGLDERDEGQADEDGRSRRARRGSRADDGGEGERADGEEADGEKTKQKWKVFKDDKGETHVERVAVPVDSDGEEVRQQKLESMEEKKSEVFSEEELLVASPVVLGFAFSEKLWLEFTVSGITEIEWNEGAFESLVLPDNHKSIVKALVESHTFHAAQNIDDVIQGKGKGLVAVLHGPPGTGKTLTAEGIAELLKCPLYMVSAGELGTDSRSLEYELNRILDIAHSWGAVLLLDEADVFLEKRTIQDIHRNALVSIFLRLLEYFQGILFLTTNRVETFDDAFQSRIHIALRYGELTTKAKKSVWKMFIERVRAVEGVAVTAFEDSDYDTLARNQLNGRQIKNCVRTAQALAVNNHEKLSMTHIKRVLDVAESFDHDLKGGTGYMDAMRSYT